MTTCSPPTPATRRSPAAPGGALKIGIGGPVGGGKTALVAALCRTLRDRMSLAVVTNDIYTTEDADFLRRHGVLPDERIRAVRTGCCPHTAIRDDITANLDAVDELVARHDPDLVLVESGGDNLTATFSYGLVHAQIFVLDVAGGDKVPRKGGPGVTRSDLLVINKIDLAPLVGADLEVMRRDAEAVREGRPTVLVSLREQPDAAPDRGLGHRAGRGPPDVTRTALAATGRLRVEPAPGRQRMQLVAVLAGGAAAHRRRAGAPGARGRRAARRRRLRPRARGGRRRRAAGGQRRGDGRAAGRARPGPRGTVRAEVGAGAHLDWAPEPSVVCDGAALAPSCGSGWPPAPGRCCARSSCSAGTASAAAGTAASSRVDVGGRRLLAHRTRAGRRRPGAVRPGRHRRARARSARWCWPARRRPREPVADRRPGTGRGCAGPGPSWPVRAGCCWPWGSRGPWSSCSTPRPRPGRRPVL